MTDVIGAALIGGILGVIGGAIASFVSFKTQKPLSEANAAQMIQDASSDLVQQYRVENKELRDKYEKLEKRTIALEADREEWIAERREWELGIGLLLAQFGELHVTPRWKPRTTAVVEQKKSATGFKK